MRRMLVRKAIYCSNVVEVPDNWTDEIVLDRANAGDFDSQLNQDEVVYEVEPEESI